MIKIKDNVDLNSLVGFSKNEDDEYFCTEPESWDYVNLVICKDRTICVRINADIEFYENTSYYKMTSVLFDLVKAGFVEEVK